MTNIDFSTVAEGYQNNKPYFHPIVINRIKKLIKPDRLLKNALDVGCGTGLSTVALKKIAENIIGTDVSREMIALAKKEKNIQYFNYSAERLPFKENSFDLITLAGSINWISRDEFFRIAKNILLPSGYLVIYDNYFLGKIKNDENFNKWYSNVFLKQYPKPLRNEKMISKKESIRYGFNFIKSEKYTNEVEYSLEEFVNYLMTLTNISVMIENSPDKILEIKGWMERQTRAFFKDSKKILIFGGYIWYFLPKNKK